MVLQRGAPDPVWGWATAGTLVTVRSAGQSHSTTAGPDGTWMIRLDSPEASAEPRELTVQAQVGGASETLRFQDVVVGGVWLMSGQSNMQMPLRGYSSQPVLRSNDAVARANDRNLRLFSVAHAVADEPAHDVVGRWETSTSANAFDFSAIGHAFITYLTDVLDVPFGAIDSS
jgi:sialate O-acetylesterase